MKLVIPVLSLETDGTRFIYQIANEMLAKGHQVNIVLPEEAFGLPPLEAMACGTAVITTDCGGNREYSMFIHENPTQLVHLI